MIQPQEKPVPITRPEALALAELICAIRPGWDARGVVTRGLGPLAKHPAPLEVIAWAAIRAARDPDNLTPAVIPLNGHHWNLADRPTTPRLTPEFECPKHIGKWAGNCGECNAEAKGRPDPETPPTDDDVHDHRSPREVARAAARQARHTLDGHDTPTPAEPPPVDHAHIYRPVEAGRLDGKPLWRNRCSCGQYQHPEMLPKPDPDGVPSDPNPVTTTTERTTP